MESQNVHSAAPSGYSSGQARVYVDMTSPSPPNSPILITQQNKAKPKQTTNLSQTTPWHSTPPPPRASSSIGGVYGGGVNYRAPSRGSLSYAIAPTDPLKSSAAINRNPNPTSGFENFGASIIKAKPSKPSSSSYNNYIKPATPGAFKQDNPSQPKQTFSKPSHQPAFYKNNGWPEWVQNGQANPVLVHSKPVPAPVSKPKQRDEDEDDNIPREDFNLDAIKVTAEDYQRYNGDADKHMQELLMGAIGDGEGEMGDEGMKEGEDVVEGFADGIKLMPHQVRGVNWMKYRETGRKYGGILADDMGLGKTVQTLARIVQGTATPAERKAGHKGGTLIIAPLAVMEQWATECKTKTKPGQLKVTTHHGASRAKLGKVLEKYDVVITTFQILASEHGAYETRGQTRIDDESDSDSEVEAGRKKKKTTKKSTIPCALFDVKWLRVVVDEAQNIKNRNTKAAKAATALRAKYRWCLTGTPIQNNVEELFSLFRFLRAKPLDDWQLFRERISSLVKEGRTKLAMKRLHVILKAVMLRRTKNATIDGKAILNLPGRTVTVTPCEFDPEEAAFYSALEKKTTLTFNKFLAAGTAMTNYTSVLTMLLRLRQACVHPSLVTASLSKDLDAVGAIEAAKAQQVEEARQANADDELADLLGGLGVESGKTCQMCFVKLEDQSANHCEACTKIASKADRGKSIDDGLPPTSAKIRMLLKLLNDINDRSKSTEKTIVFSQFTSFLDLVEPFLKREKIAYVRYDGSMRNDKRQESLEKIKNDPETRVILISFKAGSTGLNLTCCNNVILMDLWWNPALEDQAFDRAHRLGQKLDVNIFKLTIEETVEDRMLALQNAKRELANAALSGDTFKGPMKLTMNDLMKLFQRSSKSHDEDDDDSDDD